MSETKHINIRVYGIILNEKNELLLSDEYVLDRYMTKFPGGGLIPGEGTVDCLKREAIEEFGQEIEIISHYYTTDFFQKALFYADHQLISIYYKAKFSIPLKFKISVIPFDFEGKINGSQSFRWVPLNLIGEDVLTFPIDKIVLQMLKKEFSNKKH